VRSCLGHATPASGLTASVSICLGLAVCVAPTTPHWQKAATDDATTERELSDCNDQANAALASQQALIDEEVGRNWMLQGFAVVPLQRQLLLQQATEDSKRVVDSCMRAKGFTPSKAGPPSGQCQQRRRGGNRIRRMLPRLRSRVHSRA
jgi:hypothetical protein